MTRAIERVAAEFREVLAAEPLDLVRASLVFARLEYPDLSPDATMGELDRLGRAASAAVAPLAGASASERVAAVSRLLYDQAGFAGNRTHYDDFRNSLLNVVLDRRLGIPITLALVYMETARRAGITVGGVSFPGHFLLRAAEDDDEGRPIVLDPFDGGRPLGDLECRALLAQHAGEDAVFTTDLLQPCTPRQMLTRMLNNLKRTYVEWRSFPQAWAATHLTVLADPTLLFELRDRGLLAYHLDRFPSALRDLEDFARLRTWTSDDQDDRQAIAAHIQHLRRRIAGQN